MSGQDRRRLGRQADISAKMPRQPPGGKLSPSGTFGRIIATAISLAALLLLVTGGSVLRPAGLYSRNMAPLGAFLGSDGRAVDATSRFSSWVGATVVVGHTYLPGNSWRDLEGPDWALDPWSAWRVARPERMLVLNVPMVAPNEPPLGDQEAAALLRQGAAGRYDEHFRTLAERLVRRQATDTIIVLGWEMNGTTYSGRCAPDPQAWKQYWRRIVAAMRSVPGQRFRFDFAPVRGAQAVPWPLCYPGDDVVDIIGMDSYDQKPGRTFSDFIHQPYGLQDQADFAAAHGKLLSYPEWGLYDYGDDPSYVRNMHAWFSAHNVAYQTITDYCPHGVWACGANPASSHAYRHLFGVRGGRS
jgi:hypothetical protein